MWSAGRPTDIAPGAVAAPGMGDWQWFVARGEVVLVSSSFEVTSAEIAVSPAIA
jgi:hypothetical protein